MTSLIISGFLFFVWSIFIITTYYSWSYGGPSHIEATSSYSWYLLAIIGVYFAYKAWQLFISRSQEIRFGFWKILGYFLLHLFIMCISYFTLPEAQGLRWWVVLFIQIIGYLIYPFFLILLSRALGYSILINFLNKWNLEDIRLRLLVESWIGFCIISTIFLFLWLLWIFTFTGISIALLILTIISVPGWKINWGDVNSTNILYSNHKNSDSFIDLINPRLLSTEWMFLIITFLISVNFISIARPMPIWWDDLWVYMNWPKMIALTGETLQWAGFYAWQMITASGFLFWHSAPQAFFINQIGWILMILGIILSASLLLEERYVNQDGKVTLRKQLLSLPIILAGIIYAMPMIVFQQAKDMKLDPALLFFSITGITALWYGWKHEKIPYKRFFSYFSHEHHETERPMQTKENYIFLGIIWILLGFAFVVKITTLMTILAAIAFICYRTIWLLGFLGFTFLFIGSFTGLHLWDMLNVVYPKDNPDLVQSITLWFLLFSIFTFWIAIWRHGKTRWLHTIYWVLALSIGILLPLLPWVGKNIVESEKISVSSMLWWSGGTKVIDYSNIYSKDELTTKNSQQRSLMSSWWQVSDEDLGRYFWYDNGINNYLKLPANLSFQKNQSGEYTDITYIFLALIPIIFSFLLSRKSIFSFVIFWVVISCFLYYFWNKLSFTGNIYTAINEFFWQINIPYGYIYILWFFLFWVISFDLVLTPTERNRKVRWIALFTALYSFIFAISAFGIVWYGIAVYFSFLILAGLSALTFISYTDEEEKNESLMTIKILLSILFFIVISTYFIRSSFPHGWNNLRQSGFPTFKAGLVDQESAIFESHPDYLSVLAELNLSDVSKTIHDAVVKINNPILLATFQKDVTAMELYRITQWIRYGNTEQIKAFIMNIMKENPELTESLIIIGNKNLKSDTEKLQKLFFDQVLYPKAEIANTWWIYRIGTFMTYFIHKNRERYFDDSLVFAFDQYLYNSNPEITSNRMKTLGLNYFLTDLNAATIDKDPRHNLTRRFENLLRTFRSTNLELIDTDSVCLRLAIDENKRWLINESTYLELGWVNYESYPASWWTIYRWQKQVGCYNYILNMIKENKITNENYSYLIPVMNALKEKQNLTQDEVIGIFQKYITHGWFALFRVK